MQQPALIHAGCYFMINVYSEHPKNTESAFHFIMPDIDGTIGWLVSYRTGGVPFARDLIISDRSTGLAAECAAFFLGESALPDW